jgi:hypothetical protein
MTPLEVRLLRLTPALDYGLESFLSLLDVRETREVPSAAVPLGGPPRLLINPDFVARWCERDEDLLVLVLHELHHVILGHTRLFPRVTLVHNLAFDAVINAMITLRNPDGEHGGLFRRIYAANRFPELLLRPPEGFPGPAVYADGVEAAWRAALHNLYYGQTGTFHEVYSLLVEKLAVEVGDTLLLGNHEGEDEGLSEADPALFEVVRRMVERWPQPPDPRIGRSLDDVWTERTVSVRPRDPVRVMRRAILGAARAGRLERGRCAARSEEIQTAIPGRDRRAFALAAGKGVPLLYRRWVTGRPRPSGIAPVDVYIDVSGSVHSWVGQLLEAVLSCRQLVATTVFLFSDEVVETSLAELGRGHVRTTGGTSGMAVTAHIAARESKAVVVLTDGYVGDIPRAHHSACRRSRLQVILTPDGWRRDLAPVTAAFHELEER